MNEGYEGLGVIEAWGLLSSWAKWLWMSGQGRLRRPGTMEALVNGNFGGLEKGTMEDMDNRGS
jgi:hypothetical protein